MAITGAAGARGTEVATAPSSAGGANEKLGASGRDRRDSVCVEPTPRLPAIGATEGDASAWARTGATEGAGAGADAPPPFAGEGAFRRLPQS